MSKKYQPKSGSRPARRTSRRRPRTGADAFLQSNGNAGETALAQHLRLAAEDPESARAILKNILALFPCPECGSPDREEIAEDADPRVAEARAKGGVPVRCNGCCAIGIVEPDFSGLSPDQILGAMVPVLAGLRAVPVPAEGRAAGEADLVSAASPDARRSS